MALNDPYSKSEVDAKLETVSQKIVTLETKIDGKLDLILTVMKEKFDATDKRIDDLWKITLGVSIALFAAIGGIYIQNAMQRPEKAMSPVVINQLPR